MPVTINGSNTPTAGGVTYGDGTQYATTAAGTSGQLLQSNGASAPSWVAAPTTSPAGSTGQVQYNNAGAFGAISSGTSGQVLTSAGTGAAPTWATPAAGGSWIYLSTVTASSSSTVDIETTFDSTYQVYALVVSNLRGSIGSESLRTRFKLNGSYNSSSNYYWHTNQSNSSSTSYSANQGNPTTSIAVMTNVSAEVFESAQFIMYIHNPSSTTSFKSVYSIGTSTNGNSYTQNMIGYISTLETYPLTGLRFFMNGGTIVNATFRLYGIKNN